MFIEANIDDSALIISDFLPKDLFKKISEYNYSSHDFINSDDKWQKSLFKDSKENTTLKGVKSVSPIACSDGNKIVESVDLIFEEFFKVLLNCPFIPYEKKSKYEIAYYEYDRLSGLNWHTDNWYTLNYSFYIHDEWNENWGGETLIDSGRGMPLSSFPKTNSMLIIKSNIKHKVCAVVGPKKRKVLQVRGTFYE